MDISRCCAKSILQVSSLSLTVSISFSCYINSVPPFDSPFHYYQHKIYHHSHHQELPGIMISGITLNSLFSPRTQISTCVSIKDHTIFFITIWTADICFRFFFLFSRAKYRRATCIICNSFI